MNIPKRLQRKVGEPLKEGTRIIQMSVVNQKASVRGSNQYEYPEVKNATLYLKEIIAAYPDFKTSKDGEYLSTGPFEIQCNFDMRRLLKGVGPTSLLRPLFRAGAETPRLNPRPQANGEGKQTEGKPSEGKSTPAKKSSGKSVVLKDICRDLKLDPRKARAQLRKLRKQKKLPAETGGRWTWEGKDAEKVKQLLGGKSS